MKNLWTKFFNFFGNDYFKLSLFLILIFLSIFTIYVLKPEIKGDGVSYIQSIEVLKTGIIPDNFVANRIVTTYLGLQSIIFIDKFIDNIPLSWLILNSFLYVILGMFFYSLLNKILEDSGSAFIGSLFLVTNYAVLSFGLNYLMDIGGWTFYVVSLYYSLKYFETGISKYLYISALLVGVGGLFKEYAFLAYIVIFGLIIFTEKDRWFMIVKKTSLTFLISFFPMFILNLSSFFIYDYTYLSWFFNQPDYIYQSNFLEYVKSFGSLYNFGWFIFIPGVYIFFQKSKRDLKNKKIFFSWLVIFSSLPVFVWPIVTRVLFITIPAVVVVSSFFIKKIKKTYYIIPILIFYIMSAYFMDAHILNYVNLPF